MKEFGIYQMRKGEIAYFILVGPDGMHTTLLEPSYEEIEEELKKHFDFDKRVHIMSVVQERTPDIHGIMVDVEKFTTAWQEGKI